MSNRPFAYSINYGWKLDGVGTICGSVSLRVSVLLEWLQPPLPHQLLIDIVNIATRCETQNWNIDYFRDPRVLACIDEKTYLFHGVVTHV